MSEKNDGGPAFPRTQWTGSDRNAAHRDVAGMSLRDWLAGQALTAFITEWVPEDAEDKRMLAERCYEQADAMLKARAE